MRPKFRLLFLCTRNADRSIFAEYFLRAQAGDRFEVYSAGEAPAGNVNPVVTQILSENFKIDATGATRKSWHGLADIHFDFVITVCDDARERCPVFPGEPVTAHWSFPDPERFRDTPDERHHRLVQTAFQIKRRVDLFASLPMEKLDRLQRETHARHDGGETPVQSA